MSVTNANESVSGGGPPFTGQLPPPVTAANAFLNIGSNIALPTNAVTNLVSINLPNAGTYLAYGQLCVSGATTAGGVALNLVTMTTLALWVPDNHVYSLSVERTIVVPGPTTLTLAARTDATLAGASALRLDPITNAGATLIGYVQIA